MDTLEKLHEITSRLDHLEASAEWLAKTFSDKDEAAAQTGSLIAVLADDLRFRLLDLITELEKQIVLSNRLM